MKNAIIYRILEKASKNNPALEKINRIKQIAELKAKLAVTDYKAIKYTEGLYSAEEYENTKAEREALRAQIRALEEDGA
jgi:predicted transcriptional regulator